MFLKRVWQAFFSIPWLFLMLLGATSSHAQVTYTTSWISNSYATYPTYVGNAMRSMWVAPEGVVYTSSDWDESQGGINYYQNGQKLGLESSVRERSPRACLRIRCCRPGIPLLHMSA